MSCDDKRYQTKPHHTPGYLSFVRALVADVVRKKREAEAKMLSANLREATDTKKSAA